jgi:uncharacterized RDD family membrane protein YckC
MNRTSGALATMPRPAAKFDEAPLSRPANLAEAVQGSLFTPNVIAMPVRSPQPDPLAAAAPVSFSTSPSSKPQSKRPQRSPAGQGELEFLAPVQAKPRTLKTSVEAMIYCEAPVATPLHRALAAALDWAMVLIGYGLFLSIFALCGGRFDLTRSSLMFLGGVLGVIACFYGLFWMVAGTESVGMRWTHLRVITFDGFPPEAWQRMLRFAGSCLSLISVLGALWSLADEEGLGWQDHISRTFPTAHEQEARVFQRR